MMRRLAGLVVVGCLAAACGGAEEPARPGGVGPMRFAELEAAAERTRACIEAEGWEVTVVYHPDPIPGHGFEIALRDDDLDPDVTEVRGATVDRCQQEHYDPVHRRWEALHAAEIEARNQALLDRTVACLRERGFEVDDELSQAAQEAVDRQDPEAVNECRMLAHDALREAEGPG